MILIFLHYSIFFTNTRCKSFCDRLTSISVHLLFFLGCPSGYYGSNCSNSCRYPSYGVECQEECHCLKKACDHVIGCLDYAFDGKERERENEKEGYLLLKILLLLKIPKLNVRFWKNRFYRLILMSNHALSICIFIFIKQGL